jgi:hypothetical protein
MQVPPSVLVPASAGSEQCGQRLCEHFTTTTYSHACMSWCKCHQRTHSSCKCGPKNTYLVQMQPKELILGASANQPTPCECNATQRTQSWCKRNSRTQCVCKCNQRPRSWCICKQLTCISPLTVAAVSSQPTCSSVHACSFTSMPACGRVQCACRLSSSWTLPRQSAGRRPCTC